jgi:cytochrome c oxidase subunit 3
MSDIAVPLTKESRRTQVNATLGMVFFVGSWAMAFGTLFLSFLVIRDRQPAWPPEGVALPSVTMAGLGTAVLLISSLVLHQSVKRGRQGRAGFVGLWAVGLALALVFAAIQTWLWTDVWTAGGRPRSGVYEGLFYMLTWFHALHVLTGIVALLVIQFGAMSGKFGAARISPVSSVAIFWHFVDVVWLILFLGFFVF